MLDAADVAALDIVDLFDLAKKPHLEFMRLFSIEWPQLGCSHGQGLQKRWIIPLDRSRPNPIQNAHHPLECHADFGYHVLSDKLP